jgi:hypothetical protein
MVDKKEMAALLKQHFKIKGNASINDNGQVSVEGEVEIKTQVKQLPVQFHTVTGDFAVSESTLVNLKGSPILLGGSFYCVGNQLQSLSGATRSVGGSFFCARNQLQSLEGAPDSVGVDFSCENNKLTSLMGAPSFVGGDFDCSRNYTLTSLEGMPAQIQGMIYLTYESKLPLLRVLVASKGTYLVGAPGLVQRILDKYKGKGKAAALACAAELIKTGRQIQMEKGRPENPFKGNARW